LIIFCSFYFKLVLIQDSNSRGLQLIINCDSVWHSRT